MIAGHVAVVLLMIRITESEGAGRGMQRQSMSHSTDAHLKSSFTVYIHILRDIYWDIYCGAISKKEKPGPAFLPSPGHL